MLVPAIAADPADCAAGLPDSHVVKLIAESLQIVSTVLPALLSAAELEAVGRLLLRPTHQHHPYTRWAAGGRAHAMWLVRLGGALCAEKRRRWPANAPHQYEPCYAELDARLPPDMRQLPAALPETSLPVVCTSAASVPDEQQRRLIAATAAAGQRTRAFQLYYVVAKRRLWRFGGAAETAARRVAKRTQRPTAWPVPEPWASLVLAEHERRVCSLL